MKKTIRVASLAAFFALIVTSLPMTGVAGAAETREVVIEEYSFEPKSITVKPGDTVRWVNKGENQHTSISGSDGKRDGLWDSGRLQYGKDFEHEFKEPGTFPYFCEPHILFKMVGTVIVKE